MNTLIYVFIIFNCIYFRTFSNITDLYCFYFLHKHLILKWYKISKEWEFISFRNRIFIIWNIVFQIIFQTNREVYSNSRSSSLYCTALPKHPHAGHDIMHSKWLPSLLWYTVKMFCYKNNKTTGHVMTFKEIYTKPAASIRQRNMSRANTAALDLLIHAWTIHPTEPNGVPKVPLNMNFWQHEFAWTDVQPMGARHQSASANHISVLRISGGTLPLFRFWG